MKNEILNYFNINTEDVESLTPLPSDEGHQDYMLVLKKKDHVCPRCGNITHRIKDYKIRKISIKIFNNVFTTVFYKCRRYYCPNCSASFVERSTLIGERKSISPAVVVNILKDLKPYNSTFSSVARRYNVSVSTVIDLFDKHVQVPACSLPEIMCWDEFYFDRYARYKYAFMMLNFKNRAIIDILESRKTQFLSDYFFNIHINQRNRVKVIIIDMYDNYRDIAHIFFPNAKVCIDSFHVAKNMNDALNRVRKRVMRRHADKKDSIEYRLLKYRRKLLFVHQEKLEMVKTKYDGILGYHISERALVEKILDLDPELNRAYELKEQYMEFNNEQEDTFSGLAKKKEQLDQLINDCINSNIQEMIQCGSMLSKWYTELLNSFDWVDGRRLSNGPIEGKNSYVKKILSNANGFNNFTRARNKIMYSQNHNQKFSITENKNPVKRKGKPRGKYKKSDS